MVEPVEDISTNQHVDADCNEEQSSQSVNRIAWRLRARPKHAEHQSQPYAAKRDQIPINGRKDDALDRPPCPKQLLAAIQVAAKRIRFLAHKTSLPHSTATTSCRSSRRARVRP